MDSTRAGFSLLAAARAALAVSIVAIVGAGSAVAYVGDSYMQIPGIDGDWPGAPYKKAVRINAHYWNNKSMSMAGFGRRSAIFSGPAAPREGAGAIVIALDKHNRSLPQLMERCLQKTVIPELIYAESSVRARSSFELGERPATIPEYFEYRLTDVQFSDCPEVAAAPEQAIVVTFKNIEWRNFPRDKNSIDLDLEPTVLAPIKTSGRTKSFVITWFAIANDVSDGQCAALNSKPVEADYYALMPKEDADRERAELSTKGGVNYENGQMGYRGPHKLSATMLPGIVPDPGQVEPQLNLARGIDLDGDDGTGPPPAGVCKHRNYNTEDGRTGIDNQLYTAQGCIGGFQGHKGFILQFANNQMHDGQMSILVEISGIDNERNDDNVIVTLTYSLDPMTKSAAGTQVLPDYTFRVTDNPEYSHYFTRVRGRIVNGVVTTERLKAFRLNLGNVGTPRELKLADAQMRLVLQGDGTLKGVVAGYQDWRKISSTYISSTSELYHGFQQPAMYNALKRAADGMKDKLTGECNGISSAYDIEGIPAFIDSRPHKANDLHQAAQSDPSREKVR